MTIAGCDRVALGVQVASSSEAHHLWRVWKACSEENVESDVHRPRKGGVRQRISPSKASKAVTQEWGRRIKGVRLVNLTRVAERQAFEVRMQATRRYEQEATQGMASWP